MTLDDYDVIVNEIFNEFYDTSELFDQLYESMEVDTEQEGGSAEISVEYTSMEFSALVASRVFLYSQALATSHFRRTEFTSRLVGTFIRGVTLVKAPAKGMEPVHPALLRVRLDLTNFKKVELLKKVTFETMIESPQVKLLANKADHVLNSIWEKLKAPDGSKLLPRKWQKIMNYYESDERMRMRTLCDYVSGLTDKSCLDLYRRIFGYDNMSVR
jgi:dGTPase